MEDYISGVLSSPLSSINRYSARCSVTPSHDKKLFVFRNGLGAGINDCCSRSLIFCSEKCTGCPNNLSTYLVNYWKCIWGHWCVDSAYRQITLSTLLGEWLGGRLKSWSRAILLKNLASACGSSIPHHVYLGCIFKDRTRPCCSASLLVCSSF